jgi:hypothetical protein
MYAIPITVRIKGVRLGEGLSHPKVLQNFLGQVCFDHGERGF